MTPANLVKVTQNLTNLKDVLTYIKVRSEILGDVRPAFMLLVVTELIRPEVLVEVEVVAGSVMIWLCKKAKPAAGAAAAH